MYLVSLIETIRMLQSLQNRLRRFWFLPYLAPDLIEKIPTENLVEDGRVGLSSVVLSLVVIIFLYLSELLKRKVHNICLNIYRKEDNIILSFFPILYYIIVTWSSTSLKNRLPTIQCRKWSSRPSISNNSLTPYLLSTTKIHSSSLRLKKQMKLTVKWLSIFQVNRLVWTVIQKNPSRIFHEKEDILKVQISRAKNKLYTLT